MLINLRLNCYIYCNNLRG